MRRFEGKFQECRVFYTWRTLCNTTVIIMIIRDGLTEKHFTAVNYDSRVKKFTSA